MSDLTEGLRNTVGIQAGPRLPIREIRERSAERPRRRSRQKRPFGRRKRNRHAGLLARDFDVCRTLRNSPECRSWRFRRAHAIVGSLLLGGSGRLRSSRPNRRRGASAGRTRSSIYVVSSWSATGWRDSQRSPVRALRARAFYDDILSLSTKTTFDAVTHALMTTALTDAPGRKFGDGLAIIERVDSVKGEVAGTSSDRQFRMYARLTANGRQMLERSREFKRRPDNTVYHKGYPINYREQKGTPSIQVSIAMDGRLADVDVDYRGSSFPVMLVNGHLSAANSDVRAGNNAERHAARWTGFENWWRSFFGARLERAPDAAEARPPLRCRRPRGPASWI